MLRYTSSAEWSQLNVNGGYRCRVQLAMMSIEQQDIDGICENFKVQ